MSPREFAGSYSGESGNANPILKDFHSNFYCCVKKLSRAEDVQVLWMGDLLMPHNERVEDDVSLRQLFQSCGLDESY